MRKLSRAVVLAACCVAVACSMQLTAVKTVDGAAQVGTIVGTTVIPGIDKLKRDAFLKEAQDAGGTEEAKQTARSKATEWEQKLSVITKAAHDYNAAVSTSAATLALIIMGVEKKISYSDVIAQLSSAGQALNQALQAQGVDLSKYIGGK